MRFVTSIVLLVASIFLIITGIAQQTWLKPQPTSTEYLSLSGSSSAIVVGGDLLTKKADTVTVSVDAPGAIAAGVGIDSDVKAWLGDGIADSFTLDPSSSVQARTTVGTTSDVPSVAGSDLWTQQFSGENTLRFTLSVTAAESLIISGGSSVIPSSVSLTWSQDTSTPLAIPLMLIGGVLLVAGAITLILAIRHERRVISPRRKSRRAAESRRSGRAAAKKKGRRAAASMSALSVTLAVATLTGCVAGGASSSSSAESASAAENSVVSDDTPHLTTSQVENIIGEISAVATKADADKDSTLVKTRFTGAALQIRLKNYAMRAKSSKVSAPVAIPDVSPSVFLPQLDPSWPRQAFVILDDESNSEPPVALMLVQETPRSNYLVNSVVELLSGVTFPALPKAEAGGVSLAADTSLLTIAPNAVGTAYLDYVSKGSKSTYASLFSSTGDAFLEATRAHEKSVRKDLGKQATVSFSRSQDSSIAALSMSTVDSGAIVAVFVTETETSKPKSGYELTVSGEAKVLLGKSSTSKGISTTYGDMLLFSVPAAGDTTNAVSLLGFSSGLTNVKEIKK